MKSYLIIPLGLVLLSIQALAATYTVKPSGGNYTTPAACAAAAGPGDTCVIYAGSYSGWTQSKSGTAGSPITFTANSGDTVNISGSVTISGVSYVTVSYLNFTGAVKGDSNTHHCIIDHNNFTSTIINITYGSSSHDNVVSNNKAAFTSHATNAVGIVLFGDRNRIEGNEISGGGGDGLNIGGTNMVVRNNYFHDVDGGSSGEHIDFVQQMGDGVVPVTTYSLFEHNVEKNCTNDGGNCHFIILRANKTMTAGAEGNIVRYNYAYNLDGAGLVNGGGTNDSAQYTAFYNNTIALEKLYAEQGPMISCWQGVPTYALIANNISYNNNSGGNSPTGCQIGGSDQASFISGDLAFTTGYSGSWAAPYANEPTYNVLRNLNPLFANYPADATLQSGSPARNKGVALAAATTAGSSSTSLVVNNSHWFQPGWAGAKGDCVRVGASTTTCITAINYSTNTLTVSPAISWNVGDPVYLYKDSWGNVVLTGTAPDLGAYPYAAQQATAPPAPTGVTAVVQ